MDGAAGDVLGMIVSGGAGAGAGAAAAVAAVSVECSTSGRSIRSCRTRNPVCYAEANIDEGADSYSPPAGHNTKYSADRSQRLVGNTSNTNNRKHQRSKHSDEEPEEDEDDDGESDSDAASSEPEEEGESYAAEGKVSKLQKTISSAQASVFGRSKKVQAHAPARSSRRYTDHFLIACEDLCLRDGRLLATFHQILTKMPSAPNSISLADAKVAFEKLFTLRIIQRILNQLDSLGTDGAPTKRFLLKAAQKPVMSSCAQCRTNTSFLRTICSNCKLPHKCTENDANSSSSGPQVAPKKSGKQVSTILKLNEDYLDWSIVATKQKQLDAFDEEKAKKKKQQQQSKEAMIDVGEEAPTPPTTPRKKYKPSDALQSPSSSSISTASVFNGKASKQPTASETIKSSQPDGNIDVYDKLWLDGQRQAITIRAIRHIKECIAKSRKHEFGFHGGDIIFLLRNAIFKARGIEADEARLAVEFMLRKWDASTLTIVSPHSEPAHVMGYSECLHAKMEMNWMKNQQEVATAIQRVSLALQLNCVEDVLRFDATLHAFCLPQQSYCYSCGEFTGTRRGAVSKSGKLVAPTNLGTCPVDGCGADLRLEPDFEYLTESLVWTSVFRELGIDPVNCADACVRLEDVLALMKLIRPYKSLEERGKNSFKLQCYFITHLTFILTKWGACAMTPRSLFLEEYLFLKANMDVVIKANDPELVGEFLQALHILDTPHDDPVMLKGYHFLLSKEKRGKMRGNWVQAGAPFYQRYHAGYCGVIGLSEFVFDPNESVS